MPQQPLSNGGAFHRLYTLRLPDLAGQEAALTDPDAWKKNVSDIVSQKAQDRGEKAAREQTRKDLLLAEREKARVILRGEPLEGFREFASYLESQGETVAVRENLEDAKGASIGIDVSDASGLIMDVVLQGRAGATRLHWYWVYEHRGNQRQSREREVEIGEAGPSRQYVIETLAEHYQTASANR